MGRWRLSAYTASLSPQTRGPALKIVFVVLLLLHALLHLLGPAKAFGLAELPQLTIPISKTLALLWLLAATLFASTAVALLLGQRRWWIVGAIALVVSQIVISTAWGDAKWGTAANGLIALGVLYGFLSTGPLSFEAQFEAAGEAARPQRADATAAVLTESDLAPLPPAIQKYLRLTGAVGQPRIESFRARFHGEIRSDPASPWMPFTAVQQSVIDPPNRLFLMKATRNGVPFEAFHRFEGAHATMRVRLASLVPIADARGPEMDRAETVTLLNDLCLLAPSALLSLRLLWQEIDARTVRVTFAHAANMGSAVLHFAESGELIDFVSDDRLRSSSDGKSFERTRWSTPVSRYQRLGPRRLFAEGEGSWHPTSGQYSYIHFVVDEIEFNKRP